MRTRGPGESVLLLIDAVDLLVRRGVAYAVVGALAAAVHGAVRASMDADVLISLGTLDAGSLESEFKATGLRTELAQGDPHDPVVGMLRLRDSFENRVDLLIGIRGMEAQAFARRIDVPFQGRQLKFIGREDFIAMKVFAGGPLDLIDAARAITAGGDSLNRDLLRRLAAGFGHEAIQALDLLLPR